MQPVRQRDVDRVDVGIGEQRVVAVVHAQTGGEDAERLGLGRVRGGQRRHMAARRQRQRRTHEFAREFRGSQNAPAHIRHGPNLHNDARGPAYRVYARLRAHEMHWSHWVRATSFRPLAPPVKIRRMHQAGFPSLRFPGPALMALTVALVAGCAAAPSTGPSDPPGSSAGSRPPATLPAPPSPGADEAAHQQRFARWVTDFRASRAAAGIGEATLRIAFDGVQLPAARGRARPRATRVHAHGLGLPRQRGVAAARRAGPGQAGAAPRRGRCRGGALRRAGRASSSRSGAWRATTAATTATSRPSTRWPRWASKAGARTGRAASCWRR